MKGFNVELQKRGFCVSFDRKRQVTLFYREHLLSNCLLTAGVHEVDMGNGSVTCGAFGVTFDSDPRSNEELIAFVHQIIDRVCAAPRWLVKLADVVHWQSDPCNDFDRQRQHTRQAQLAQGIKDLNLPSFAESVGINVG